MDSKEDGEGNEDKPLSPIWVLQHLSEEAVRVAGDAIQSVYPGNAKLTPSEPRHRRSQSEVVTISHRRSNSFQRLKSHVQKACRWGSNPREDARGAGFNPEILANQKRLWYKNHSKVMDHTNYKEPTALFEHFIVAGLHPESNLEPVEVAFAKRKKWEMEMGKSEIIDFKMLQQRRPSVPMLEPQILFKYPPGKRLQVRYKDLSSFCFPGGVKAQLVERTPSLSDLNELIYGQEHLGRDDLSFIFSLKVADNATLYGVCMHVMEIVQRAPDILGLSSPFSHSSRGCNRFLVSAPRCYCILTKVPFFESHFEMLNSIISQQRLNRITEFVNEMSHYDYVPSTPRKQDQMHEIVESPERKPFCDWMSSAIPVDSAVAITAAAAGIISEEGTPPSSIRIWEPHSPESFTASESSEFSQPRDTDRDGRRNLQYLDDSSELSDTRSETQERIHGSYESSLSSPEVRMSFSSIFRPLETSESLFSPAKSMTSEDDEDGYLSNFEKDLSDDLIMEWAKENKNDVLQIVCAYHAHPLPPRGSKLVFQPHDHLQSIEYWRPSVSDLGIYEKYLDSSLSSQVIFKLAAAEEAHALSMWTTATICRVLSLDNVLALLAGVLLEKQVVIVCSNLGVLSAMVLSLTPMILPFQWQSLMLPVLPVRMLEFLEAPVPFIVGLLNKPNDLKIKTSNLVLVNVFKDQVKTCSLPTLPRYKELASALAPIHVRLSRENSTAKRHPVHMCSETQAEDAGQFLRVMRGYLESFCSEMRFHTITSVQANNDRVSLLLKDSFIDSFPSRDQPFIKLFVDTQMFTVLSDSRLSRYENGHS